MKTSQICMSAAVLLMVAISAQAQDIKPPFEWKISGDNAENFKAEFVLNAKIDQSTPEGTVNGYSLLTDQRTEYLKQLVTYSRAAEAAVNKTVDPMFEKLLSEELNKIRLDAKAESSKESEGSYTAEAETITGVTDGKDGAKLVETSQKGSYLTDGYDPESGEPTGKKEKQEFDNKYRYTCVKQGEKWLIDRTECWGMDWSSMGDDGEPKEGWIETSHRLMWYTDREELAKAAEFRQDSAENAALTLFNCVFRTQYNLNSELYARGASDWVAAGRGLFTERGLKGPEEDGMKFEVPDNTRVVDKVSDGENGVKKVKFKTRNEWAGAVEVHVKLVGETWKVVSAGYYEIEWTDMGKTKEGAFVETKNLTELSWR